MSECNSKTLKHGWRRVKFGDVVRLSKARSQDPLSDGFERYVGLEHLEPNNLRIGSWGNVADGVTFTSVFHPGQVLFGKRRAYQRKVSVANFSGVCSGDIYVLESKDAQTLLPELLPFICQTDAFFDHAVGTSAGSLSPRTNWTSLADFEFALPPKEDQLRIADLLFASSELEQSFHHLQNLGEVAYQAAINQLIKPTPSDFERLHETSLTIPLMLAAKITDCKHLTPKTADVGVAMISPGIIKWGALNLTNCKSVEPGEYQRLMDHVSVSVGDLVMGRNQNFGIAAYVTNTTAFVLGQDTVLMQPSAMPSHYIYLALRSAFVQRQISSLSIGSTFKRINLENIRKILIPVATPDVIAKSEIVWRSFESGNVTISERRAAAREQHAHILNAALMGYR